MAEEQTLNVKLKIHDEDKNDDIYRAMNLLDEAVQRRGADEVVDGIEAWLNEDDQDCPDFREALAQGIQDAITHAMIINEGQTTITIIGPGGAMLRFEWFIEDEPSETFNRTVITAMKRVLKDGR